MMMPAKKNVLFGLGDVFDSQHTRILDPSLKVVGLGMPGVRDIELLLLVPGVAPEEYVADGIGLNGRPEHRGEPVFDGQLLRACLCQGDEFLMLLAHFCQPA
jgi:hypothetical protein